MPPSLSVLVFKLYCVVYILSANSFSVFFFLLLIFYRRRRRLFGDILKVS